MSHLKATPDKPDAAIAGMIDVVDMVRRRISDYGRLISLARGCLEDDSASAEQRCAAALSILQIESQL